MTQTVDATKVRESQIIFTGESVRAILDGRKTQTRRVMQVQPCDYQAPPNVHAPRHPAAYFDSYCGQTKTGVNPRGMSDRWCWWTPDDRQGPDWIRCPYGKPGDRLWVRETFSSRSITGWSAAHGEQDAECLTFRADLPDNVARTYRDWSPSIHMPRWASRITLELTEVRVERVQDISEADCWAEGIERSTESPTQASTIYSDYAHPRRAFCLLWDSINAKRGYGWDVNPWVWVLSFTVADSRPSALGSET